MYLARAKVGATIAAMLTFAAVTAVPVGAESPSLAVGGSQITRRAMEEHVHQLSTPDMEGRENGTEGARRAAEYVAAKFRAYGLTPAGTSETPDGSPAAESKGRKKAGAYYQPYSGYTGVRVEGVIGLRDDNRGYGFNDDYTPLGMSTDGKHTGELAFVGYGISAPELEYDDYAGIDVRDKIVVAFLGEPGMRDPNSRFDGTAPTAYSDLYVKAETAREHGAKGLILTPGPLYAKDVDRVWKISTDIAFRDSGIMICQMTNNAAKSLVGPAGLDLAAIQKQIDDDHEPHSLAIPNHVEMLVKLRRVETEMANVVAKVPGKTDRSVVLVANLDGYGMGPDNSRPAVHPSANDNATGVAVLLEVARVVEQMPESERTVYFVVTSGRRLTAAGSEALLRDAVIDPEKVDLFINMFALGSRNLSELEVMGTGSGTGLKLLLGSVNKQVRAPVSLDTDNALSSAGDHIPWYRAGVPVLTLFGGAAREIGTPLDTEDAIDWGSLERRARYAYGLVRAASEWSEAFSSANGR
ncbi:MAG: M28 family peptidase [Candidatus Eisenbacteria bacterium]